MGSSSRRFLIGGLWAASLAAVIVVARQASAPPGAAPLSGERTFVVERRADPRVIDRGPTIEQLRTVVREELAAAAREAPTAPVAADPAPHAAAAFVRAEETLTEAMADGRWTDDDRQAFLTSLVDVDGEHLEVLLQTVVPAINRGELVVETAGSPL